MEERRNFKRIGYESNVRCNLASDGAQSDVITKTVNISGGGIGVASREPLTSQQAISLEISIPGYLKSIFARGEVIWTDLAEAEVDSVSGIKFTKIDTYDRQMILDYIHFG